MRSAPHQSSQGSSHHHHHNSKSSPPIMTSSSTADHCCSCNNCSNASNVADKDFYNICECTSCRNLGNSIDICCQCCSCSSEYPRYHVASMAMQEDTLEVCLQQQTADLSSADATADSASNEVDDIALAHSMSERSCHDCHPPPVSSCCHPRANNVVGGPGVPPGGGPAHHRGPVFHGWQQQMRKSVKQHVCNKGKILVAVQNLPYFLIPLYCLTIVESFFYFSMLHKNLIFFIY